MNKMDNYTVLGYFKILFKRLSKKRKRELIFLFFIIIISAFAETLSLASAFPFLQIIIDQDNIWQNQIISNIFEIFGLGRTDNLILPICIVFALSAILASKLKIYNLWLSGQLAAKISFDLSFQCFKQNIYQDYEKQLDKNSSNLITNNAVYITICNEILAATGRFFSNIIIGLSISLYLIIFDPFLAISSIIIFGLVYILLGKLLQKKLLFNSNVIEENSRNQVKIMQESIGSLRDIILSGNQKFFLNLYEKVELKIRFKNAENSFITMLPRPIVEGLFLVTLSILVYLISFDKSSFSNTIAILGTFAIGAQKLLPCMQQSYSTWSYIIGAKSSLINILNLSTNKVDKLLTSYKAKPYNLKKSIKLQNISYKYPKSKNFIFENINLEIIKGEKVGIIGKSGIGKSTIVDIIIGLLEPKSGSLEIDGINILDKKYPFRKLNWRKSISHVPQNIFLKDLTFAENIAFGEDLEFININKVRKAAIKANIDEFIMAQPLKYKSRIGENGVMLSGGQRQRIGIARAFYNHSNIIVLDEATSALDIKTEDKIMDTVYENIEDITLIIISHRENTIKKCDKVIEIENKNIFIKSSQY